MKADQLAASIVEDAQRRVQEIEEETAKEVSKIERETEAILKKKEQDMLADVRKREQEEVHRQEAKRERDARIARLQRKQELIDETFTMAGTSLGLLKGRERQRLLKHLWKRATDAMDVGSVIVAKKDAAFVKAKIQKKTDGLGGFIAQSKDGRVSMDLRFETLLEDVKERDVRGVAQALFEEGR